MTGSKPARHLRVASTTLALAGALISASSIAQGPQDYTVDLLPGEACKEFGLRVESRGGNQVVKEYFDKNGYKVRMLSAGKGSALSFQNLSTGAALSIKPNGSVSRTSFNPDGSQTWVTTGHNVLILFSTDTGGPSTTQYVGRVVFTVDSSSVFTVQSASGKSTDICALLSG